MVKVGDIYIRNDVEKHMGTPNYIMIVVDIKDHKIVSRRIDDRGQHTFHTLSHEEFFIRYDEVTYEVE